MVCGSIHPSTPPNPSFPFSSLHWPPLPYPSLYPFEFVSTLSPLAHPSFLPHSDTLDDDDEVLWALAEQLGDKDFVVFVGGAEYAHTLLVRHVCVYVL